MKDMKDFLRKLEENLDVMDKNIDDMFTRAHEADLQTEAVESLRKRREKAKKHVERLRNVADEDAADAQREAHTAWEDLKQAFATVRSRLGD